MEAFARTGEAIRATSSKLEKTRLLGEYFASLDDETFPLSAVYFAARPFADRDQRMLNLGYAVIRSAVCEIAQVDEEALGESYMRHSDVGFFFQAEDGIRDLIVTGVQTCALPI